MAAASTVPARDEYWAKLEPHLPSFSAAEQRAAVALYRELARGTAVDAAQLATALGISPAESRALLERESIKSFAYPDDKGRVVGFGGLAAAPMHHRFEVDRQTLWTWCAWDRRTRSPRRDARWNRVFRSRWGANFLHPARCGGLWHIRHQCDGEVLPLHFLFCCALLGRTLDREASGNISLHSGRRFCLAKKLNARNFGLELARAWNPRRGVLPG